MKKQYVYLWSGIKALLHKKCKNIFLEASFDLNVKDQNQIKFLESLNKTYQIR